jgi:hypothetical protein
MSNTTIPTTDTVPTTQTTNIPDYKQIPVATPNTESSDSNVVTYVLIGVCIIVVVLLIYYAYKRFIKNSIKDPFTKGQEQERDDPVVDFNLREAVLELQDMQKQILKTLSDNAQI